MSVQKKSLIDKQPVTKKASITSNSSDATQTADEGSLKTSSLTAHTMLRRKNMTHSALKKSRGMGVAAYRKA